MLSLRTVPILRRLVITTTRSRVLRFRGGVVGVGGEHCRPTAASADAPECIYRPVPGHAGPRRKQRPSDHGPLPVVALHHPWTVSPLTPIPSAPNAADRSRPPPPRVTDFYQQIRTYTMKTRRSRLTEFSHFFSPDLYYCPVVVLTSDFSFYTDLLWRFVSRIDISYRRYIVVISADTENTFILYCNQSDERKQQRAKHLWFSSIFSLNVLTLSFWTKITFSNTRTIENR